MKKLSSSLWIMFDMVDVIHMSKISNHYLLEYQTLLDSYEMQAPNVTNGFRVLDFADDISDVDYTSDDWSFGDSYSEASGDIHSLQGNHSEYSCSAGSKPLSLIIRRCNTPVASSSPVPEIEDENTPGIKLSCAPPPSCLSNQVNVQPLSDASNKPLNDGKLSIHSDVVSSERDVSKSKSVLSHVGTNINSSELFSSNKVYDNDCEKNEKRLNTQKSSCSSAVLENKKVLVRNTSEKNSAGNGTHNSVNELKACNSKEANSPSDKLNSELLPNISLASETCSSPGTDGFGALFPPTENYLVNKNSVQLENVDEDTSGNISREHFCALNFENESKEAKAEDGRSENKVTESSKTDTEEFHPLCKGEEFLTKTKEITSDRREITGDVTSKKVCQDVSNILELSCEISGGSEEKNAVCAEDKKCIKSSPGEKSIFCDTARVESSSDEIQSSSTPDAVYKVSSFGTKGDNCASSMGTSLGIDLLNSNKLIDRKVLSPSSMLKDHNVSQIIGTAFPPVELPKEMCSTSLFSSASILGTDCKVTHTASGPFTECKHVGQPKPFIVPRIPSPPISFESLCHISVNQETPSLFTDPPLMNRQIEPRSHTRTIGSATSCSSETSITDSASLIPNLPCPLATETISSLCSVDHKLSRPGSSLMPIEIPCQSSKSVMNTLFSDTYEGKLSCVSSVSVPKVTSSFSALDQKLSGGTCLATNSWQSDIPFDDIALHAPDGGFPDAAEALDCKDLENSRLLSCSPLLFSSDDESCSVTEEVCKGIELALAPSPPPGSSALAEAACMLSAEKARVRRLQELLTGAPPPPAVTQPPHTALDVLLALHERAPWAAAGTKEQTTVQIQPCHSWIEEASTMSWPQVKFLQHPGIHYNHGAASEQFESLCQKLLARCVGVETASSVCGEVPAPPAPRRRRPPSAPRRPSNGPPTGLSPGRRLSHLARRRRAFSSSALLASTSATGSGSGANNAAVGATGGGGASALRPTLPHSQPERRTILVAHTRKKIPKQRKSSSKKRSLQIDHSSTLQAAKINSSKRALFQSPTEEERKPASAHSKFRPSGSNPSVFSKRRLFTDETQGVSAHSGSSNQSDIGRTSARKSDRKKGGSTKKRQREDSDSEFQRLPKRRLFSDGEHLAQPLPGCSKTETRDRERSHGKLSATHKKKLLWAVAEALKEKGIGLSHANFRPCATALAARLQRGLVQQLVAERQGSTSDSMLQLARRFVGEALEQQGESLP